MSPIYYFKGYLDSNRESCCSQQPCYLQSSHPMAIPSTVLWTDILYPFRLFGKKNLGSYLHTLQTLISNEKKTVHFQTFCKNRMLFCYYLSFSVWFLIKFLKKYKNLSPFMCKTDFFYIVCLQWCTLSFSLSHTHSSIPSQPILQLPTAKYGVRSPKFIWASCAQQCSLAEIPQLPPPPPLRIWAHIRGAIGQPR